MLPIRVLVSLDRTVICCATTEKPRPASPARAASIEELREKYGLQPNKTKIDTETNITTSSNQDTNNNNIQYNFMKKIDVKKLNINDNNRNYRTNNNRLYDLKKINKNKNYNENTTIN